MLWDKLDHQGAPGRCPGRTRFKQRKKTTPAVQAVLWQGKQSTAWLA